MADGAHDITKQLSLSGEPLIPDLSSVFKATDPIPLLEYQNLTVEGRNYEAEYCDYWNSTRCDKGMIGLKLNKCTCDTNMTSRSACRCGHHARCASRGSDSWKILFHR